MRRSMDIGTKWLLKGRRFIGSSMRRRNVHRINNILGMALHPMLRPHPFKQNIRI